MNEKLYDISLFLIYDWSRRKKVILSDVLIKNGLIFEGILLFDFFRKLGRRTMRRVTILGSYFYF
jgi:hypothetical protein